MQNESIWKRMISFAESKGFYMILGLCVVAIGVSAYVLFFTTPDQPDIVGEVLPGEGQADVSNTVPDVNVPKDTQMKEPSSVQRTEETQQPNIPPQTTVTTEPKPTAAEVPVEVPVSTPNPVKDKIFTLPVQSAVVDRNYSGDQLVKDPTMGDWRTHGGTDFLCEEGDDVIAVLDGTIAAIDTDAMMGQYIRLDHGAGLESLYCGVIPHDGLKVGQQVSVGQKIGRAAGDTLAESAQTCHVHLEMTEDGIAVDPMSVLK